MTQFDREELVAEFERQARGIDVSEEVFLFVQEARRQILNDLRSYVVALLWSDECPEDNSHGQVANWINEQLEKQR